MTSSQRKKEQNKLASKRFRERKKQQMEQARMEIAELEVRNDLLRKKEEYMRSELENLRRVLLERNLIRRETDGEDRRRSVLDLSDAGYAIYDEVVPVARACERTLMSHLDAEEAEQLDRLLAKLEHGMRGLQDAVDAATESATGPLASEGPAD